MTLNQFFLELKRRQLTLRIDNDTIEIEGESQRISEKIKTFVADHQEAIREAREKREEVNLLDTSLEDFARSKKTFVLRSNILGEDIVISADNAPESVYNMGYIVYTATELTSICSMSPDEVKKIHKTKKAFEGTVTVEPASPPPL